MSARLAASDLFGKRIRHRGSGTPQTAPTQSPRREKGQPLFAYRNTGKNRPRTPYHRYAQPEGTFSPAPPPSGIPAPPDWMMESIMDGLELDAGISPLARPPRRNESSAGSPFDHGTSRNHFLTEGPHGVSVRILGRLSEKAARSMRAHGDTGYEHPHEVILGADVAIHRTW